MSCCASVCPFAFFFSNIRSDTYMFVYAIRQIVISRSKSASTLPPFGRWMHWFLGNSIGCSDFSLTCWYNALFYYSPRAHTLGTITSEYCQHVMIESEKKNLQWMWMWPPITAFATSTGSPVCDRTQRFNFSFCLLYTELRSIESRWPLWIIFMLAMTQASVQPRDYHFCCTRQQKNCSCIGLKRSMGK